MRMVIKDIAQKKGIGITELAYKSGVNQVTMNRYWHNKSISIEFGILEKIAKTLEVKPKELLDDSDEMQCTREKEPRKKRSIAV